MTDRRTRARASSLRTPARPPARGSLLLMAVLVVLAALAAVAVPRVLAQATIGELRGALAELAPERRDLVATLTTGGILGAPDEATAPSALDPALRPQFGALEQALARFREEQRAPLGELLEPAQFVGFSPDILVAPAEPRPDDPGYIVRLVADPVGAERIRITEGRPPEPAPPIDPDDILIGDVEIVVELVLSTRTAERMRWSVGEERTISGGERLALVGVFEPVDAQHPYWQRVTSVLEPEIFDDGNQRPRVTGTGFIAPLDVGNVVSLSTLLAWFPLELDALAIESADELAGQLRVVGDAPSPLAIQGAPGAAARFETDAVEAIDAVLGRSAATGAVLAMLASGPAGVLLSAIGMAGLTVVARRRPTLALLHDRGASGPRLRRGMALVGLAAGAPAVVLGVGLGVLVLPGSPGSTLVDPAQLGVLLALALVPATILGVATRVEPALAATAGDGRSGRGALRGVLEVVVVLLAVIAIVVLLQRGVTASAASTALDPVLVLAPLLAAVAASVLALRASPFIVRVAAASANRRGTAVDQVGAARAVRDRVGVPPATFALVVAVAVATFSGGVLAAVDDSIDETARDAVGADIRLSGFGIDPGDSARRSAEAVSLLADVEAVATVVDAGPVPVGFGSQRSSATLFIVDESIAAVRGGLPYAWPRVEPTPPDAPVPVVLSAALLDRSYAAELGSAADDLAIGAVDADIVAVGRPASGYGPGSAWVLIGAADAERLGITRLDPDLVLVDLRAGVDADAVIDELLAASPDGVRAASSASTAEALRDAPTTALLRTGLAASTVVVALLAVIVLGLALASSAPARRRATAVLGALGARPRGRLLAWQLIPAAVVAGVVGLALGGALPLLVIAAVDFSAVTGSPAPPAVVVDPLVLGVAAGALAVVVAAIIAVGARGERRTPLAPTLRSETS